MHIGTDDASALTLAERANAQIAKFIAEAISSGITRTIRQQKRQVLNRLC